MGEDEGGGGPKDMSPLPSIPSHVGEGRFFCKMLEINSQI